MSTTAVVADLTTLDGCEAVIERGLVTFVEVGEALLSIRDARLYRESHGTFEDYCQERWGLRREVADRYVRAAEVVDVLNPIGLPAPANESVARELAPLRDEPEQMREVWQEAREECVRYFLHQSETLFPVKARPTNAYLADEAA